MSERKYTIIRATSTNLTLFHSIRRSLAEIEHCILRGRMVSTPPNKIPFVGPLKTSSMYKVNYALSAVDLRINFVLNHGFR